MHAIYAPLPRPWDDCIGRLDASDIWGKLRAHAAITSVPLDTEDIKTALIALLPRMRRFAMSMTRSATEADDLVQEACLRAISRADQWDPAQPLDRWVFRIARNLWISELRKRKVRVGQGQVPAEETHELVSSETGETTVAAAQLTSRIWALPEELSSVLLLVSVEGYTYKEASALLEIPLGTVMSRIHRARKILSEQLCDPTGAVP
mgnify:CR=1 FL=1